MNFMPGEIDMSREYVEVLDSGVVVRVDTDKMSIPACMGNHDYLRYLEWKRLGGRPSTKDETVVKTVQERRQEEYVKQGAKIEDMVVALWEKLVEGRPESADAIQAIRDKVKLDLPKSK